MFKTQKLKILALLLLMAGFVGFSQAQAGAFGLPDLNKSVGKTAGEKIIKYCAGQLNLSANSNSSRLAACTYGYTLGMDDKDDAGCGKTFKNDNNAIQACKNKGYPAGKQDKANVKPNDKDKDKDKDPAKEKDKCQGSECTNTPTGQGKNCDDSQCDLIALYVNPAIQLLSAVVGLVVAASLIMGGIQYAASSGDPQKTGAAKSRIQNTLLAFLAYAFLYAFLNFLIPGGLFK